MADVEPGQHGRVPQLQAGVLAGPGIVTRVDELPEGKEADRDRVRLVGRRARHPQQHVIGKQGDLGPDVRQAPVRGNEDGAVRLAAVRAGPRES